jgi:hypothetical protein
MMETGEVVRSDGSPQGKGNAAQRPAQRVFRAVRRVWARFLPSPPVQGMVTFRTAPRGEPVACRAPHAATAAGRSAEQSAGARVAPVSSAQQGLSRAVRRAS